MQYSLKTKLSVSYVLITLVCVFVISFIANILLDQQFRDYITQKNQQRTQHIVNLISQQYKDNGEWDKSTIEDIGVNSLEDGVIVKVIDANDNVVWDAMVHNNGLCTQMLSHMAENMKSRYPDWEGEYVKSRYPLIHKDVNVGTVEVGYFGPFYFNDNDLAFINTLNKMLVWMSVFLLLLALGLGAFMAKRISTPIVRVTNATEMISKGFFQNKINEKSNTKEISQLTDSVNDLAESLKKQESLRKRLTADVAHELRTPLATLQSHMEAMIDGIWKADTPRLKSCHEEIVRISKMVGDLEKLAKFERDNMEINSSSFDIAELIQSIIFNFENEFKEKQISLISNLEKHMVYGDKDKIKQVLVNLISNALKYTPEGGKVEVITKLSDENIGIVVRDNGIGISEDDLPYIFERFYRVDMSRNRMTGGSGIGLAIAKALVEVQGGRILVKSKISEGTEFIILLPK